MSRSISSAKKLEIFYNDEDELRKEEVAKIGGPNEFKEFYDRNYVSIFVKPMKVFYVTCYFSMKTI